MYTPVFLKKVKNCIFRKNNWSADFVESEPLPFSGVIHNKLDDKLVFFFFLFFPENRMWHFMKIVNPVFWEKEEKFFKMSAEILPSMQRIKSTLNVRGAWDTPN